MARTLDRKSIPIVAWYMLSNESYMNLVISEVLPTVEHRVSNENDAIRWSGKPWHTALFSQKHQPVVDHVPSAIGPHTPTIDHRVWHLLEFLQGVVVGPSCLRHLG